MTFTDRAVSEKVITTSEAKMLEDWIDFALMAGEKETPDCLKVLYSKVHEFNFSKGRLQ